MTERTPPYYLQAGRGPQANPAQYEDLLVGRRAAQEFLANVTTIQYSGFGLPMQSPNGTVVNPARAWVNDQYSGTYRLGSLNFGESVNKSLVFDWNVSRIKFASGFSVDITDMTLGSVLIAGTGGRVSQDNAKFFYDATNHRLGLGTTSPARGLHIVDATNPQLRLAADATYFFEMQAVSATGEFYLRPNTGGGLTTINGYIAASMSSYVCWNIYNQDSTHSSANAFLFIWTNGASAGDPYLNFYNGVTDWAIGMDNSDSDKLKISVGDFVDSDPAIIIETDKTVWFGSHTALGAETVTGYITIKDRGGSTRKLAVVS